MRQYFGVFAVLAICYGPTWGRETKPMRPMPAISNSLVNLGKMEISFHFPSPFKTDDLNAHLGSPFFGVNPDVQIETENCPCSSIKNFRNPFLNNPADMINKILKSNDLFSANQEPIVSAMCCGDSHEPEDTIFFDFTPSNAIDSLSSPKSLSSHLKHPVPSFPLFLDTLLPPFPMTNFLVGKQKPVDIFLFGKGNDGKVDFKSFPKLKKVKKAEIQIVGDKELRNDFKRMKLRPLKQTDQKKFENKMEKARQEVKENQELQRVKQQKENQQNEKQEKERQEKEMQEKKEDLKFKDEIVTTVAPPITL